jgi:hypothetical protein
MRCQGGQGAGRGERRRVEQRCTEKARKWSWRGGGLQQAAAWPPHGRETAPGMARGSQRL